MANMTVTVLDKEQGILQLNNARMSFFCLWKPNLYKGKATGRQVSVYTFNEEEKPELKKVVQLALYQMQKVDPSVKSPSEARNDRFKPYVDKKSGEEYLTFRTSNDEKYPAAYVDERGRLQRQVDPEMEDRIFYQGCRVNCKIQLKAKAGRDGIDLWSNLVAIQFAGDDQRIGGMSDNDIVKGFGTVERELPSPAQREEADESDLDPAPPQGKRRGVTIDDLV